MNILLGIIFIVFFIGIFIIIAIAGFIKSLFGFGKSKSNNEKEKIFSTPDSKSKVFTKDEGEYVDYEEIK